MYWGIAYNDFMPRPRDDKCTTQLVSPAVRFDPIWTSSLDNEEIVTFESKPEVSFCRGRHKDALVPLVVQKVGSVVQI